MNPKISIPAAIFLIFVWLISIVTSLAISAAIIALAGDLIGLWDVVEWL